MKYHIDTIPIWDAFKLESECPLCVIKRHFEVQECEKFLGASVMDPDTRLRVNEKGFCSNHYTMLIKGNNRLGLSLMLETFVENHKQDILNSIKDAGKSLASKSLVNIGKNKQIKEKVENISHTLNDLSQKCVLCESIDKNMERYAITVLEMWKNEPAFKEAFKNSKGMCVTHIAQLLKLSYKYLNAKEAQEFTDTLYNLTEKSLTRQEEELKLLIKKYDYRFTDLPWGNSKDSLERIINKMQGWCVGEEPHPEDRNKDRKF